MALKRWHLNGRGYCNEDSEGSWVEYKDVEAAVQEAYQNGKKEGARQEHQAKISAYLARNGDD